MDELRNLTIEQLKDAVKMTAASKEKVSILNELGRKYRQNGDYLVAIDYFLKASALSDEVNDKSGWVASIVGQGLICYEQGDFKKAFLLYNDGLAVAEKLGMDEHLTSVYNNIGTIHKEQGNNPMALEYFYKGLAIAKRIGRENVLPSYYNNIGLIHQDQNDYDLALEFFYKVLTITEKLNDRMLMSASYNNIGVVHKLQGDYTQALEHHYKALRLREDAANKLNIAGSYMNIGAIYTELRDFNKALEYLSKALNISQEIGHKKAEANSLTDLGAAYLAMGNHERANEYLLAALDASKVINNKILYKDTLGRLYKLKKELGDVTAALDYHEQYIEAKDEQGKEESYKNVANLRLGHELEIKEKEKEMIEAVLHKILPPAIAARIANGEERIIERFQHTSILFADIHGFTTWGAGRDVNEVAETLAKLFQFFDELALQFGVEKIKTIGDAYMCATGLPQPCDDHAERLARMALAMQQQIGVIFPAGEIRLRIGIHTGEVIAGIIGKNKYAYDLWGDTVNTASRMESHGIVDRIQVSEQFHDLLRGKFEFERRGETEIKGKGKMNTYFLIK